MRMTHNCRLLIILFVSWWTHFQVWFLQNYRTNSAPICHETAWKCMDLHIGKVLKYEYYWVLWSCIDIWKVQISYKFIFHERDDCMKKYFRNFCAACGGCLIGFWARSLDTTIGCLLFTLGIILLVGSLISEDGNKKKDKEEK